MRRVVAHRIGLADPLAVHQIRGDEIVGRYGLGILAAGLGGAMDAGVIERQPVMALAHVITGALDAAALYVAEADDPLEARKEMEPVLDRLVEKLRA